MHYRIVRAVLVIVAILAAGSQALAAEEIEARAARSEERLIADLAGPDAVLRLSERRPVLRAPFTIAPGAQVATVELVLSARPESLASGGRLSVSVNGGRPIVLTPRPDPFEARFALYSADLRPGRNLLSLSFEAEGDDGWVLDAAGTRLRLETAPASGFTSLSDVEAALAADFAAPSRIHVDGGDGANAAAHAALAAQGAALRAGVTPVFTASPATAELTIRARIAAGDTAAVTLAAPAVIELTGPGAPGALAAARLFADRSLAGAGARFTAADALGAQRLGRTSAAAAADGAAALARFAASASPVGDDQGARSAIIIAGAGAENRAAALSILARGALASGGAWSFAWFGEDAAAAPASLDRLILGPADTLDETILRGAPAMVLEAVESAGRNAAPRRRGFFGSAAYADSPSADIAGVAAVYEDRAGRTVALFTAPEAEGFARAAIRLSRSDLWNRLDGETAAWTATAVTPVSEAPHAASLLPFDLSTAGRWLALTLFAAAALMIASAGVVNRSSSPAE